MNADDFNPKQVLLEVERMHKSRNCACCQSLPPVFLSGQQIRLRDARDAAVSEWNDLLKKIQELKERQGRVGIAVDLLNREFRKIWRHQAGITKKAGMPTVGHHFENLLQKVAQNQTVFDEQCFLKHYQPLVEPISPMQGFHRSIVD